MKKYVLIGVSIVLLVQAMFMGIILYRTYSYSPPSTSDISEFTQGLDISSTFTRSTRLTDTVDLSQGDFASLKINAWIPSWGMEAGLRTLEEKKEYIDVVSPVFYEMIDGGFIEVDRDGLEELQRIAEGTEIKIVPAISGFDPDQMNAILKDGDALQRHADFLLEEVTTYDYDGLDLNYESIFLKDKKAFFTLVEILSEGLKKNSKMLSITVLSKWGDDIDYSFAPQTREVQNYKELEPYADQLRIMTYDFTSQGSATSGPIAPEEWVREVLDYTKGTGIAMNKVVLGVHMYGYSWPENNKAKALDYRIVHILQKTNETTQTNYDPESNEATISYIKEGVPHSGYYASPEVIKARLNIAVEYGLQGVSFWRLGDDQL